MRSTVPKLISLMVVLIGIIDITSAVIPANLTRWIIVRDFLPIEIIHTSRTLTLLGGFYLVSLGRALYQQKKRAWQLTIMTLIATLVFHLSKGLDIEEVLFSALAIILLWYFKSLYFVESHRTLLLHAFIKSLMIILLLFIYMVTGYTVLHQSFSGTRTFQSYRREYIYDTTGVGKDQIFAINRFAHWFENSISFVSMVSLGASLLALFSPAFERSRPTKKDITDLIELLKNSQSDNAYFSLMNDKTIWFDDNRSHAVAYKKIGKYAIALGLPIGEENTIGTAWQFQEIITKLGGEIIWYNIEGSASASQLGLSTIKIGEDAVINVLDFTLVGSRLKDVRNAVSRNSKSNIYFQWTTMADITWQDLKLVDDLHRSWVNHKKISNLTFSLGFYPFPVLREGKILLAKDQAGNLLSVLTFFPYAQNRGYSLDFMMRSSIAPSGIIETSIVESIYHFRNEGIKYLNLGMAPLANIEFMGQTKLVSTIRNMLLTQFNKYYGYKSLHAFKEKFSPTWISKYIYVKKKASLPSALIAVASAHKIK